MELSGAISDFEAAIATQLELVGDDPVVEEAGAALLGALEPALRSALLSLVEQAAEEVAAQLPDISVDVVLSEGEPDLVVRATDAPVAVNTDDLSARLTVRLPSTLKVELEDAAGELGDSVNTYVVKALSSRSSKKWSKRITETFET
ncbi:MAG: hypothetical protein ACE5GC_04480 [Acidimicrobiia bacterium]